MCSMRVKLWDDRRCLSRWVDNFQSYGFILVPRRNSVFKAYDDQKALEEVEFAASGVKKVSEALCVVRCCLL